MYIVCIQTQECKKDTELEEEQLHKLANLKVIFKFGAFTVMTDFYDL